MTDVIVPVSGSFGDEVVRLQVQVNESALAQAVDADPERNVSILGRRKDQKPFELDDVGRSIASIAQTVTGALVQIAPDEAEVEFGVDIGVESGQLTSLLVKGTATATLKVRLLWKNDKATVADNDG
jgi:hypothetical protein